MSRLLPSLLLALAPLAVALPAAAPAAAAAEPVRYIADTHGEFTVTPDGRASELRVDPRDLGEATLGAIGAAVGKWEFAPVAAPTRVRARFFLQAEELGDGNVRVTVEDTKLDPVETGGIGIDIGFAPPPKFESGPPHGIAAEMIVALQIGADGRPSAVAVDEMVLIGKRLRPGDREPFVVGVTRAAEWYAKQWRVRGPVGDVVRRPYTIDFRRELGHDRATRSDVGLEDPAWLVAARAAGRVHDVDPGQRLAQGRRTHFPTWAIRENLGARVMIAVSVAPDGGVREAVLDAAWLVGDHVGKYDDATARRLAERFAEGALERVRDGWQFVPGTEGVVLVPFAFHVSDMSSGAWIRARRFDFADPDWLAEDRRDGTAPDVAPDEAAPPVRLLTRLNRFGTPPAGAGG